MQNLYKKKFTELKKLCVRSSTKYLVEKNSVPGIFQNTSVEKQKVLTKITKTGNKLNDENHCRFL